MVKITSDGWSSESTGDGVRAHVAPDGQARTSFTIAAPPVAFHGFTSSWGMEFTPCSHPDMLELSSLSGRSSQGAVPWLGIETLEGWVVLTLAWSGNWSIRAERHEDNAMITVDFPDGHAGWTIAPTVLEAQGDTRNAATTSLARSLARNAPKSSHILTEWNHWWPYEDAEITEEVFLANASFAADMGFDVAVLDAGWFGRPGDTEWYQVRGDWDHVNTARFPHGLEWLADQTRQRGIDFGIWIEGEALGEQADAAAARPEIVARDAQGKPLGYVCLGAPEGLAFARDSVVRLVQTTRARWIKWDFNLDPGSGCARDDHGHKANDGLQRHYEALYNLFDELRRSHPDVVWECCSSGGLRIDPGLAAHVNAFFLSDPDWTEHHLKVLWGACQILPPRQILHWMQSEWRGEHRFQKVDYSGSLLKEPAFDTMVRASLLHRFGASVRLTEMRPDLSQRLAEHLRVWRQHVLPLLEDGVLFPLTGQPEINEQGTRKVAFQLESGDRSVVAAFRLPPAWEWDATIPDVISNTTYRVTSLVPGDEQVVELTATELSEIGLPVPAGDATSAMWLLERKS